MVTLGYEIEEIEAFTLERLKNIDTIEHIEVTIGDIEIGREWGDAAAFIRVLRKYPDLLDQKNSALEVVNRYWDFWARAAFMVTPEALTDKNIEVLYQEHILEAFRHHEDPRKILDDHLKMRLYSQELVPKFVVILRSLETNTQLIGTEPLKHLGKPVSPQVRWWLAEYRAANDRAGQRGGMEEATFLAKNHNAQLLSAEDREMLKKIIQFDDYLQYPVVVGDSKDWFLNKIIDDALEVEKFEEEQKKEDAEATVVPAPVVPSVIPAHDRLPAAGRESKNGDVDSPTLRPEPPKDDPITRIRDMVGSGNFAPLLAGRAPTSKNLAAVLREAYTKRAGLDDSQGAREAVHIANLLKKHGRPEFMNMAYYDASSQSFKWNE